MAKRGWSKAYVVAHDKLKGYLLKIYVDNKLEIHTWENWLKRIQGAQAIQQAIDRYDYHHFFKVPNKWIYPLPIEPSASDKYHAKYFILVVEDMNILAQSANYMLWRSNLMTPALLDAIYVLLQEEGLCDNIYPFNFPFCEDGKIAFIDTECHHLWPVKFDRLTKYFSRENRAYWKLLTDNGGPP